MKTLKDATGLSGGDSRWLLDIGSSSFRKDATALRGGVSRSLANGMLKGQLAASMNLHGASPWHVRLRARTVRGVQVPSRYTLSGL